MDLREIDEIEAEANAATEGPWETTEKKVTGWNGKHGVQSKDGWSVVPCACDWEGFGYGASDPDSAFIAHARTNVPNLCRELRKYMKAYKNLAGYVAKIDPKVKKEDEVFQGIYSAETENRFLVEAES